MTVLGPVFWYDLIRNGRRTRYLVLRCLYVALLLAAFWTTYRQYGEHLRVQGLRGNVSQADLAVFGERFFGYFLLIQYAALVVIAPAYVASAIAEEKQRKTLEFMLATDLTRREIVLGKLGSRLGLLAMLALAGLPVISCAQLLGGISPMLLWCGFIATVVTLFSLTSISLLVSTYARRVRDALINSYLVIVGYLIFWGFLRLFVWLLKLDEVPLAARVIMDGVVHAYELANPFMVIYGLADHVRKTGSLGNEPLWSLLAYASWHLVVGLGCLLWAHWRVRSVYVRQAFGRQSASRPELPAANQVIGEVHVQSGWDPVGLDTPPPATHVLIANDSRARGMHPPLGDDAMLWKELFVEKGMKFGAIGQVLLIYLALAIFGPGLVITGAALLQLWATNDVSGFEEIMNKYVRVAGTLLYAILLLGICVRTASCISIEKDRQTYDGLLASPLSLGCILRAKWLGSLLAFRRVVMVLMAIWLLGLVTSGVHWLGYVHLHVALLVHAAFSTSLGLACATTLRSGLRAMALTVFTLVLLYGGPLLVDAVYDVADRPWGPFVLGFSPPHVTYEAAFSTSEWLQHDRISYGLHPAIQSLLWSTELYSMLAVGACTGAYLAFTQSSGRTKQRSVLPRESHVGN